MSAEVPLMYYRFERNVALSFRRISHVYGDAHRISRDHIVHSYSRGNEEQ